MGSPARVRGRQSDRCGPVLLRETVHLVLDVHRDVGEGVGVLASVVPAEEQVTGGEHDAHVGLGTTAVTAVGCGQGSCCRGGHMNMEPRRLVLHPPLRPWFALRVVGRSAPGGGIHTVEPTAARLPERRASGV